jgi:hypothetical protein
LFEPCFAWSRPGDITLGKGTCEEVQDYLKSELSDDRPGTNGYVFGKEAVAECLGKGRCRIAQLVTRAMAEACTQIPSGARTYQFAQGITGGGGAAVGELCTGSASEIKKCVGSPLVLDLAGDGLQLKGLDGGGTSFPLLGRRPLAVGWLVV